MNKINTRKALNPAYRKHKPLRKEVTNFITELQTCINAVKLSDENNESEEHIKYHFTTFFKNTFYANNYINTKDRIDLAIYTENNPKSEVSVLIEAKKPSNKNEFLKEDNLNKKALQELLLYYLRERIDNNNNSIKHLIATNGYEWYLFKAEDFYTYFFKNKALLKEYQNFRDGLKDSSKNELFYNEIAQKYIGEIQDKLPFVYLNFAQTNFQKLSDAHLNTLYKIFSDVHILGKTFGNDSNQLNKAFYNELLHIIGLEEIKEKGKKIINRKKQENRDYASLLENTIFHIEDRDYLSKIKSIPNNSDKQFNAGLELCLTWINRILFLKLLESQLVTYHQNNQKYRFLHTKFINGFDDLNDLFFSALAKPIEQRHPKYKDKYQEIPYLNSSLFEKNTLENEAFEISALNNDEIQIYNNTVLKNSKGKKQQGKLPTLDYLFQFLDAYDFATDGNEGITDEIETKTLINASVLGLIFEKINGYKEGSFYTPAYITMYMCKETIRRAVVQKFKEHENNQIENFQDLKQYCSRFFKSEDLKRLNNIVNSIKICDPAVGSGHFLVSALNELIVIKNELRILTDAKGILLNCDIEIVNDELYITNQNNGLLFEYNPKSKESTKIQHTLFHQKQTLIENCLFGVDINPNSVKICRLRLWIELLKNAYYTPKNTLQTLPNIDINIKCGNSLISRFNLNDDLKEAFNNKELNYSFIDYKNAVAEYKDTNDKNRKKEVLQIIEQVKNNFKSTLDNSFIQKYQKIQGTLINEQERQKNLINFGEKIKKSEKDELKKLQIKAQKAFQEKEEITNNAIYHNAFEWRFEFPEVLSEDGNYIGFDAVIGNPPYFQIQYSEYSSMDYFSKYKVFEKTGDIYSVFFEKGIEILNELGILSYITSNRFCTTNYGESTRNYLSKTEIISLVNLNDVDIFDEANVGTLISILRKNDINLLKNNIKIIDIKELNQAHSIQKISNNSLRNINQSFFDNKQWIFTSKKIFTLKDKIEKKGTPLKNIQDLKINRGITTGANAIFIIDKKIGNSMIKVNPKNSEILKPVLKGAEIKRYFAKDYSNYIILSKTNVNIKEYPEVYTYLKKHKAKLENVYEAKKGTKKWYELRKCSYYDSFTQDKLIWTKLSNINSFAISNKSEYSIDSTSFAIGENLKYYSAILNSKLIYFYFKLGSVIWGKDGIKWFGNYFDNLPIIIPSNYDILNIEEKVNKILSIKKENPESDTSVLEKQIDQMVYKLYGLTADEVAIVEGF
ncbi:type IIG restriction enzyme/methyltransferase [Tenacibaculum piscium]|uniref:type IIG restriction enzyme/methyltransferase n=1 Tax=Tenacibaculum piscium TaxID=1458515 RepID=UPI00187B2EBB|nr:Eco57I restriction-modification methylase domain-containing protein [Tenacibaculum piscium]MBE7689825.1 type II restriction endonuclease [Tenacibaculum piscium]